MSELLTISTAVGLGMAACYLLGRIDANNLWRKWNDDSRYGYAPDGKDSLGLTQKQRSSDKV